MTADLHPSIDHQRSSVYPPLTLHVPEPAVRPGGTPDFSNVQIPKAGSVARPEVDADPESIRDLAYSVNLPFCEDN